MARIEYSAIAESYLIRIKQQSNEYSVSDVEVQLNETKKTRKLFGFGADTYESYNFTMRKIKEYAYEMFRTIILNLFLADGMTVKDRIPLKDNNGNWKQVILTDLFRDYVSAPPIVLLKEEVNSKRLIIFKEYGINKLPPKSAFFFAMKMAEATEMELVSLVDKNASSECLTPGADESYGVMSIKDFFVKYFDEEEYCAFETFEREFSDKVDKYLGYQVVKKLTPSVLYSFKKKTVGVIFRKIDSLARKNRTLQYNRVSIEKQFKRNEFYRTLLGSTDYAVSFITAEWMYQAINNGGTMDYSPVAMGFFKAVEMFLFDVVKLYAGTGKEIYRNGNSRENISAGKYLFDAAFLDDYHNYIMLDSLINFVKENDDIFSEDYNEYLKRYLVNCLYHQKQLRNGYFHKENLLDWRVVEEARNNAIAIFFVMLGLLSVPEEKKEILGVPSKKEQFDVLCDYVNYNAKKVYYLVDENGEMHVTIGQHDDFVEYDEYGTPAYSGVYFRELDGIAAEQTIMTIMQLRRMEKKKLCFHRDNLPQRIYEGTMLVSQEVNAAMELSGPQRCIWKNRSFIGGSL